MVVPISANTSRLSPELKRGASRSADSDRISGAKMVARPKNKTAISTTSATKTRSSQWYRLPRIKITATALKDKTAEAKRSGMKAVRPTAAPERLPDW